MAAEVVRGTAFDVLLTRSHRAGMVVVGSFGSDTPAGLLVGSTALTLVARSGCPVAVVRGRDKELAPPRGGPVLVGVDGTPASDAALDLAADIGASLGAGLLAVHTRTDVAAAAGGGAHRDSATWSERSDQAERSLDEQLARTAAHRGAVPLERRLVAGTPLPDVTTAATGRGDRLPTRERASG